jgi:undecaprenyl-diphosphatase
MRANRYGWLALVFAVLLLGTLATAGFTTTLDRRILDAFVLQAGISPNWLIQSTQFVSWTGGGIQRYIFVLLISFALWRWRSGAQGLAMALSSLSSSIVSDVLKAAYNRPRPDISPHLDIVTNAAYPSGHSCSAAVVYLLLILLAPPETRKFWLWPMLVLTLLTGLSRIMLGVHYPSDVIGGWMLGAAFAIGAYAFVNTKESTT